MPLTVELDDGQRWRMCSPRARVAVNVRWHELPNEAAADRPIPYVRKTTRLLWGIDEGKGVLPCGSEPREWQDCVIVEAGSFFARCVSFRVTEGSDPPRRASVWLVPKGSAVVALLLVVISLGVVALRTAATLSTLHLNFSYSHAVTGLGGLTLLGLAAKAVHSVSGQLRLHGLPLYGLGYLLGRTVVVCLLGACAIGVALPTCVTTLVNETKAKVELKLPDSPERLELGPGQRVTFLGPVGDVLERVDHAFVEHDKFCVAADPGAFDRVMVPLAQARGELDAADCRVRRTDDDFDPRMSLPSTLFAPAHLDLGCRSTIWEGVTAEQIQLEPDAGAFADAKGDTVWLDTNDECEPVEGAKARVVLDPPPGDGFVARYEIRHPWTWARVRDAARIVVEAEPGPMMLRITGIDPEAPDGGGAGTAPRLVLEATAGRHVSAPIPTPFLATATELPIVLGSPNGSGMVPHGALRCMRHEVDVDTHFRLVGLPLLGAQSRVLEVRASSSALPTWESTWNNLQPLADKGTAPRVCLVSPGRGLDPVVAHPIPAGSRSLSVRVSFPRFGEALALRLPSDVAARRIEIMAQSDTGAKIRGALTCAPASPEAIVAYEIGPVWVRDWSNRSTRGVAELLVEDVPRQAADPGDGTWRGRWYSHWVLDGGRSPAVDGWFPPWVCRPVAAKDDGCLGCNRSEPQQGTITARVRTSRWYDADVSLSQEQAKLRAPRPNTCHLDAQTHQRARVCRVRCKTLGSTQRDRYNRDLGTQCAVIHICADSEAEC